MHKKYFCVDVQVMMILFDKYFVNVRYNILVSYMNLFHKIINHEKERKRH